MSKIVFLWAKLPPSRKIMMMMILKFVLWNFTSDEWAILVLFLFFPHPEVKGELKD
jgi:hypothetical protein